MFETPVALERNQSGLIGKWQVGEEQATLEQAPGKIIFRFHARDLRLGLRPVPSGKPLRFRFTIDGAPPGSAHGVDTNAQG